MPPEPPQQPTPEALQALRERLQATQAAAQKLAEDAASAAASASDRPPPMGWDVPRSSERANEELEALLALVGSLRDLLPPELRAELVRIARSILEFVRAVLDWWIGRMEGGAIGDEPDERDDVQDIPIT